MLPNYFGSHYDSILWALDSDMANQYFNAWTMCVKLTWQVPRATHTYFVDHLLSNGMTGVRMDTLARYSRFVKGLMASPSPEVAIMCSVARKEIRTVTGSNLALIVKEIGWTHLRPALVT